MRQSRQEIIDDAVKQLEHFRSRIGMYIAPRDVRNTVSFLTGFRMGLATAGIEFSDGAESKVWTSRGWKFSNRGPIEDMGAKGLDVQAIVHELVEIEITILRQHTAHAG